MNSMWSKKSPESAITVELYHKSYRPDESNPKSMMQNFADGSKCALSPSVIKEIDSQRTIIQKCAPTIAETILNAPENQRNSPKKIADIVLKHLADNYKFASNDLPPLEITVGNKTSKFEFGFRDYIFRPTTYGYHEIKWYHDSSLPQYSHTTKIEM